MDYKDILVFADGTKTAAGRLDAAAKMAQVCNGRLIAVHVAGPPYVPADLMGTVPSEVITWQEKTIREETEAARKEVAAAERRCGRNIEWRSFVTDDFTPTMLRHARYADLTVLSQSAREPAEMTRADELPDAMLVGSGRPLLIVPRYGSFPVIGDNVLIAWKPTREATRAVHDALALLKRAKRVSVLEVNPERDADRRDDRDLATHLAAHGITAEIASTVADDIGVGDVLLSRAADLGADLIIMGGYGHSRLREFTFGGATRHMLERMTVPVFMSH